MTPRRARQDDLAEIVAIYNSTVASGQSTADLQPVRIEQRQAWFDAHRQPHRPLYVWRDGQQNMTAWASFSDYYPREAYRISAEISMYIHESYRGRGLGREILAFMLALAPDLGVRNVLAVIFAHNAASLHLFERFGFETWGRLPAVCEMPKRTADVLILGKALTDH